MQLLWYGIRSACRYVLPLTRLQQHFLSSSNYWDQGVGIKCARVQKWLFALVALTRKPIHWLLASTVGEIVNHEDQLTTYIWRALSLKKLSNKPEWSPFAHCGWALLVDCFSGFYKCTVEGWLEKRLMVRVLIEMVEYLRVNLGSKKERKIYACRSAACMKERASH
eukprot:983342-Pelagomonas_calceolata.AAC.2